MKNIHSIHLSVFVKPEEDCEKLKSTFLSFFPFNLEKEKIILKETNATGFQEQIIKILEVILDKEKHIALFLDDLLQKLEPEKKELLLRQKESRLDEDNFFFMRFDKNHLLNENRLFIVDTGNCFHLKMHIASYPAKREKALEVVQEIFKT